MKREPKQLFLAFFLVAVATWFTGLTARSAIQQVKKSQLRKHIRSLCSIHPPRQFKNIPSLNRAAQYIFAQFKKSGLFPHYQPYRLKDGIYRNIIASYGPPQGDIIIIGAHYDVCGNQPGADDNASGVAAILELGRLLAKEKPPLNTSVMLAAYTLEEPPIFNTPGMGSAVHAESMRIKKARIKLMISLDMIGYFSETNYKSPYPVPPMLPESYRGGPATSIIGRIQDAGIIKSLWHQIQKNTTHQFLYGAYPPETPAIDYSDHRNFLNRGYSAVWIGNFFATPNPHYHQAEDTIEKLDMEKMTEVVRAVYLGILSMAKE